MLYEQKIKQDVNHYYLLCVSVFLVFPDVNLNHRGFCLLFFSITFLIFVVVDYLKIYYCFSYFFK